MSTEDATPSGYERQAIDQIRQWKRARAGDPPTDPALAMESLARAAPGGRWLGPIVAPLTRSLLGALNNVAQWSVPSQSIYQQFRQAGLEVENHADLARLDLADIDRVAGRRLDARYRLIASAEGMATGVAGLPGLIADLPLTLSIGLRAIGEYASYYGFDLSQPEERLYALNILSLASGRAPVNRMQAMTQLVLMGRQLAAGRSLTQLAEHTFVRLATMTAKAVGIRLTQRKLTQILPIIGGLAGAATNYRYIGQICEAARHLYRERFLAARYGPQVIADAAPEPGAFEVAENGELRLLDARNPESDQNPPRK